MIEANNPDIQLKNLKKMHAGSPEVTSNDETINQEDSTNASINEIGPWTRCFARSLDLYICGIICLIFIGFLTGFSCLSEFEDSKLFEIGYVLVITFVFVFIEPILLCTWGTTIGKYLFRITLRDKDGEKLTFNTALKRSVLVYLKGLALGLPIITAIANLIGFSNLVKNRITSWDQKLDLRVTHQKIGIFRGLTIILIHVCILAFALLS